MWAIYPVLCALSCEDTILTVGVRSRTGGCGEVTHSLDTRPGPFLTRASITGSASLPQDCACVPRSDGPGHALHLPGCSAHHPGLPAVHLFWMLQAPQPMELQGTGRSDTPQAGQRSSLLPHPRVCVNGVPVAPSFGSGVCCGFLPSFPPSPIPAPPLVSQLGCIGSLVPAAPIILLGYWSVCLGDLSSERLALFVIVSAVVHRQKNQLVTKEVKPRPTCPRHSQ